MDRVQFIHSINPNMITTSDLFINYFDQSMLLYTLVPEGSKVIVSNNSLNSIQFSITTTKTHANHLAKFLNTNNIFNPYRKFVSVEYTQDNNILNLTMTM